MAMEAGRSARAHRPPAAGEGLQRHADGPLVPHRGGRAMNGDDTNELEKLIAAAIGAAEDLRDPLEGLVERTATDPGAPFAPDTLVRLAALKKDDRAAFEALRAQLKGAGA